MSIHQHPPSPVLSVPIAPIQPIYPLPTTTPESMMMAVKTILIAAHTDYSVYPIRVELSPQNVRKLAEETGDGTAIYGPDQRSCQVRALSTLNSDYIKCVFPLEEGPVRG